MEVREVTVARSYKVNLGNYENVDVLVSMHAELDMALDDTVQETAGLAKAVEDAALHQVVSVYRARGKRVSETEVRRRHGILA